MHTALVVDDHPFIRASVKMVLEQQQFEVLAETDNGVDALELARLHLPGIIVLDIGIPRLDGLEVITRIGALGLSIKTLVLTAQPADYFSLRCMRAGAVGFVSKTGDLTDLGKALKAITSGYTYFPELSTSSVRKRDMDTDEAALIASLSDRELMVLQYLARGVGNKQIGDALSLSNKTVSTYKSRLIEKLKVSSLLDLGDLAKRHQLI